ncbi:MAG: PKD domain-containing protein [Chitinophagaceae bacterium]
MSFRANAQSESHDFITYDTTFISNAGGWNIRISRPKDLFTVNHPDTASRPAIVFMVGVGEACNCFDRLALNGPHALYPSSWDGGVQLANGKHYPILISVQPHTAWPSSRSAGLLLTHLINTYHIKAKGVHITGLSMGAMTWSFMLSAEQTAGDRTWMKKVTSATLLQGQSNANGAPAYQLGGDVAVPDPFATWARDFNGKALVLTGTTDYSGPHGFLVTEPMNAAVPGSGYFAWENIGGGAHCCWNEMYSPAHTDWTSVGSVLGQGIVAGGWEPHANTAGTYYKGNNLFQWMLRQGDTALAGTSVTPPVTPPVVVPPVTPPVIPQTNTINTSVQVGPGEYQIFFIKEDGTLYGSGNPVNTGVGAGSPAIPRPVIVSPSDLKFKHVYGGLHGGAAVDVNGNVWTMGDPAFGLSGTGSYAFIDKAQKILTDINGNPFTGVKSLMSFFTNNAGELIGWFAIKDDGTLWVWGQLGAFRGDGTNITNAHVTRPAQITIPGNRSVQQVTGADYAIVLCTDGTVWTFGPTDAGNLGYPMTGNQYLTPHQIPSLSNITQIAGGKGFNYALASNGVLYGWGSWGNLLCDQTFPGGPGAVIQTPVNLNNTVTSYFPAPISKIVTNFLTTTVLLSNGDLYSWGENSLGMVGNGEKLYGNNTTGYAWDFAIHSLVKKPYHVAPGVKFSNVWGGHSWVFYTYAMTTDGKLLAWGRNKSSVITNKIEGAANGTIEAAYPNGWDVKWPTQVDPFNITTAYVSTCETCLTNPGGNPCSNYPIPANTRPVANAGNYQNVSQTTAKLNGSGSTDNVYIMYYEWSQVSGPNTAVIDLPASPTPNVSGLVSGTYTFKLKVTDNGWLSDSTTVQLSVGSQPNVPPTANAGASQIITLPISLVTLSGSGNDPDGSIASYSWSILSGGPAVIVTPFLPATLMTGLGAGVYIARLTVTDNLGATGTSDVTITVNPLIGTPPVVTPPSNQPPTANAGADQTITYPMSSLTLSGGGADADGTIVSYAWSQVSGTAATINSPSTNSTNITGLTATGVRVFRLTVTDNKGATATDDVTITVNGAAPPSTNQLPTANAGADQTIIYPLSSVTLSGNGSDPDGTIVSYTWTLVSGTAATIASPSTNSTNITGLTTAGVRVFRLTVTDNNGATATDDVTITVNGAAPPSTNQLPTANAGADQTITYPLSSVTFTGSGTDADGTIVSYEWSQVSGTAATINSPSTYSTNITGLTTAGARVFRLTVTDNNGATATDDVTITVNAAPAPVNQLPVSNAGADQSITLPTNNVTVYGNGSSDPDGVIASYAWSKIAGPSQFTITSSSLIQTTITDLVQGVYQFELKVTDNNGATATDVVVITVNAAVPPPVNQAPVANAGADQTITLPLNNTTVYGNGSSDPDGTIASYAWSKIAGPSSFTITSPSLIQTTITNLVQGVYQFELKITDNQGATATDVVVITVNAAVPPPVANQSPVANSGADQTITLPLNNVTVNGNGSTDPDGTIAAYTWSKIAGPAQFTITSSAQMQTTITNLVQGVYQFELKITDNQGATATDVVVITVNAAVPPPVVNQAPVAKAGTNLSITLPLNNVTVNGNGSIDADGTIASYQWSKIAGPSQFSIEQANQVQTAITNLVHGVYQFELKVTDNQGAVDMDTISIVVNESGHRASSVPVYPNPAANIINVTIDAPLQAGSTSIRIFDAKGIVVYQEQFARTQQLMIKQIDINKLTKGFYVIEIGVADNSRRTQSFIKM